LTALVHINDHHANFCISCTGHYSWIHISTRFNDTGLVCWSLT
jgi:hypothetical protein